MENAKGHDGSGQKQRLGKGCKSLRQKEEV